MLARVATDCKDNGIAILAIKADLLAPEIANQEKLGRFLGLPDTVSRCLRVVAQTQRVVVLVDQLDAVADLVNLRSERLNVLLSLIKDVENTSKRQDCLFMSRL